MSDRAHRRLASGRRALDRLGEARAVPAGAPLAADGSVRRFELAWKGLKGALAHEGIETPTPREAFALELLPRLPEAHAALARAETVVARRVRG